MCQEPSFLCLVSAATFGVLQLNVGNFVRFPCADSSKCHFTVTVFSDNFSSWWQRGLNPRPPSCTTLVAIRKVYFQIFSMIYIHNCCWSVSYEPTVSLQDVQRATHDEYKIHEIPASYTIWPSLKRCVVGFKPAGFQPKCNL